MSTRIQIAVLTLLFGVIAPPSILAADAASIDEEFRQTLLRLAQSGALPTDTVPMTIEHPAERVANFGLLVDSDHEAGLLILGTLPGGSAERIGLRTGDRLVEANGLDLRGAGGSAKMRSLLDGLDERSEMSLRVLRDGGEQRLAGTVESVQLPAMRVQLNPAESGSAHVQGDANSSCARITVFPAAPRSRDLFEAILIAVDGKVPGPPSQDTFRLTPGRHILTVAENIDERYFSAVNNQQRSRGGRQRYKELEIDAQPGVLYLLAARFHPDLSTRVLDGSYWQPVIWKERAEACR